MSITEEQCDRVIVASAFCSGISLVLNFPSFFGYPKIWQIVFFGSISIIFMILSSIRFRKENKY
jgi:hypothetical protein